MSTKAFTSFPGFKFGCDPELFVIDSNGTPVSAAGLIPGTKENPYPVEYGAVQVDGMAAEFNIDPVDNYSDFSRNIKAVVRQLEAMLPNGHKLAALPSVIFSEEVFRNAPMEARELGCMPDYNAWTSAKNPPPGAKSKGVSPFLRTAAGHIHIGWQDPSSDVTPEHIVNCNDLVKQLDWYLGLWSLSKDKDVTRRSLYGKAGACRYKPYGVEYRVLSNFWVLDGELRKQTWNRLQRAIYDMQERCIEDLSGGMWSREVRKSIDTTGDNGFMAEIYPYPVATLDVRRSAYN